MQVEMGCLHSREQPQAAPKPTPSLIGSRVHTRSDQDGAYYMFKLLLLGDIDTGKTSLLCRFVEDSFITAYFPTIGVDFQIRTVYMDTVRIKLQIWDVSGEHCSTAAKCSLYRSSAGIVITYNTIKRETFNSVPYWLEQVRRNARPDVKLVLVGTKCDCTDERVVSYITAKHFAVERQIPFFEVSNKEGTNVEVAFMTLVAELRNHSMQKLNTD